MTENKRLVNEALRNLKDMTRVGSHVTDRAVSLQSELEDTMQESRTAAEIAENVINQTTSDNRVNSYYLYVFIETVSADSTR